MPVTINGTTGVSLVESGALPFLVGQVCFFAMDTAPDGFLKANGAAVSRTTFSALFNAIGTTFGAGDGSTTFNLPDLRGEFPRGWDDGRGVDSGRSFGTAQLDQMRKHSHRFGTEGAGQSGSRGIVRSFNTSIDDAATAGPRAQFVSNGDQNFSGVAGGTDQRTFMGDEVRPCNIALLACIKF